MSKAIQLISGRIENQFQVLFKSLPMHIVDDQLLICRTNLFDPIVKNKYFKGSVKLPGNKEALNIKHS